MIRLKAVRGSMVHRKKFISVLLAGRNVSVSTAMREQLPLHWKSEFVQIISSLFLVADQISAFLCVGSKCTISARKSCCGQSLEHDFRR
jgi:hypothetical protein